MILSLGIRHCFARHLDVRSYFANPSSFYETISHNYQAFLNFPQQQLQSIMSNALDMSLEDIIKNTKSSEPRNNNRSSRGGPRGGPRGGRTSSSSGPTRNGRQGRDNRPYQAGVQQYRATPVAPLHTSVIRQSIPDGSKMQVSNLDYRVSAEDLKVN